MLTWSDNLIDKEFTHQESKEGQPEMYEAISAKAKEFAKLLKDLCPGSAETTLALRKLQEAVMWANASIAIAGHVAEVKVSDVSDDDAHTIILSACDQIRAIGWALRDQDKIAQAGVLFDAVCEIKRAVGE